MFDNKIFPLIYFFFLFSLMHLCQHQRERERERKRFARCGAELPGNDRRASGLIRQTFAIAFIRKWKVAKRVARETVRSLLKYNSPDWFSSVPPRMPFSSSSSFCLPLGNKQVECKRIKKTRTAIATRFSTFLYNKNSSVLRRFFPSFSVGCIYSLGRTTVTLWLFFSSFCIERASIQSPIDEEMKKSFSGLTVNSS
jgi:hypothetical protein